jgi:hypothetical protein
MRTTTEQRIPARRTSRVVTVRLGRVIGWRNAQGVVTSSAVVAVGPVVGAAACAPQALAGGLDIAVAALANHESTAFGSGPT